jgi:hypothetical protein
MAKCLAGSLLFIPEMADPLAPFMTTLVIAFAVVTIGATLIGTLMGHFMKKGEKWLINSVRSRRTPNRARSSRPVNEFQEDLLLDAPPACPRCRQPMVKRLAKKGLKKDSRFWGCPTFPACRGDQGDGVKDRDGSPREHPEERSQDKAASQERW